MYSKRSSLNGMGVLPSLNGMGESSEIADRVESVRVSGLVSVVELSVSRNDMAVAPMNSKQLLLPAQHCVRLGLSTSCPRG